MTTTVRIPLRLEQALAQYCTETRRSKSEVIIELLEQRFAAKQPEKTAYEIACETGFIGSLTAAEDMAGNAKHSIRDAIARKHGRA
jgi:DNA recombination-dependent growth factor C